MGQLTYQCEGGSTLNYFCKLFGDNYIDYLKQVAWEEHCFVEPPNKRTHVLKNDLETHEFKISKID